MEIFKLFGTIFVKDDASKALENVEKKADSANNKMSGMEGVFGKAGESIANIGKTMVAAFAVEKIVEFGKGMVEASAKIQALDSQFTQTFKNNGSEAMKMITEQSKEQNIQVDRLKGTWASFYGTFRGNGADANQSLDLTNKYMKLAADGAAYYDLSLEDVSSRLKSITMGNFEAGDAIGVNINATKMDILAKEQYKKKWQDLTDTEREYLLVNTVGKIYENNGAMGQANREANSYTNVMANLKATWERFLSVIGSPVLKVVIDVIQGITNTITQLQAKLQSFNPGDFVTKLKADIPSLGVTFEGLKIIFNTVRDSFIQIVTTIIQTAQKWYSDNKATVDQIVQTFNSCMGLVKQIITDATTIIMALWNTFGKYIFDIIAQYLQWMADKVKAVLEIISGVFKLVSSIIQGDWKGAWEAIKQILSGALTLIYQLVVEKLVGAVVGKFKEFSTKASETFSSLKNSATEKFNAIKDAIMKPIQTAVDFVGKQIEKIKSFFSGLKLELPHIKLPHFNLSGSFSLEKGTVPSLGVQWYADGGILTQPTIFGMNGNRPMVGGEAGAEAVLPIEKLSGIMADTLKNIGFGDVYVVLDGETIAKATAKYNDKIQGKNLNYNRRGLV